MDDAAGDEEFLVELLRELVRSDDADWLSVAPATGQLAESDVDSLAIQFSATVLPVNRLTKRLDCVSIASFSLGVPMVLQFIGRFKCMPLPLEYQPPADRYNADRVQSTDEQHDLQGGVRERR